MRKRKSGSLSTTSKVGETPSCWNCGFWFHLKHGILILFLILLLPLLPLWVWLCLPREIDDY